MIRSRSKPGVALAIIASVMGLGTAAVAESAAAGPDKTSSDFAPVRGYSRTPYEYGTALECRKTRLKNARKGWVRP